MLQVNIPGTEYYDEANNEFILIEPRTIQVEHSLISISKWEAKWNKPFMGKEEKTPEEVLDYIRCMTITQNVDPLAYHALPASEINKIKDYINAPMTATWFNDRNKRPSNKVITSELIYYYMVANEIPFECEKWHFNRLLTLIRICGEKNQPAKKMSKREAMAQQRSLNAARRARHNSSG